MTNPGRKPIDRPSSAVTITPPASVALERPSRPVILLAFASILFVVLFWRLGTPSFWDPDEAHYAQTTREMLSSGDWLAPYYNEQAFFDKPMLFHWAQAAAMSGAGPTEFGARLVPALAALGLVGLTGWLGATLVSGEVGVLAALLLATSPGLFALARYAILDTLFTVFVFGGAAFVSVAALQRRTQLQWLGYGLIALAALTKGPVAIVLCGLAFCLTIALSAEARARFLDLHWVAGLTLVIVLSAPWFVYMWLRFGDSFVGGYLLDENLRLYATNRFGPGPSAWFYFRVLAAGLLPWTTVVVGRLYDDIRAAFRRDGSLEQIDILLWSWTIAVVGFFSLSRFKLDHYVFPAGPALCLLCGRAWLSMRNRRFDPRNTGARVGLYLVGPMMVAIALGGGYMLLGRLDLPRTALIVPAAVGIAGVAMTANINVRGGRPPRVPWLVIGALTIAYAGIVVWVLPALEQRKPVPDVARWVAERAGASDRIATYRLNRWNTAFRFYVGRHVAMIDAPDEVRVLFKGAPGFYCTMLRPAYEEFVAEGLPLRVVYEREGMWATSGRVLWRRRIPSTHFVVVTRGP
jgi:4-amino-4-deoxy-L-arabinose transferase-like glycosyltransferase